MCADFKNCSELLCQAAIECIVKERFGSKALKGVQTVTAQENVGAEASA